MAFDDSVDQFSYQRYVQHFVLIVNIRKFSSESIHRFGNKSKFPDCSMDLQTPAYDSLNSYYQYIFVPQIYANGRNVDGKGYVSVIFHCSTPLNYRYEFSCIVAVLDVSGKKRFPQSFTFFHDPNSPANSESGFAVFSVHKYISRETLLREPLDLLPDDCLTLHIDIRTVSEFPDSDQEEYITISDLVTLSFEQGIPEGEDFNLYLDSVIARRLYEVSSVFQTMFDCLKYDNISRTIKIPYKEVSAFWDVCRIILGAKIIVVNTIDHVCKIYVVADKYDIQSVIDTSRQFIKSFLCEKNDPEIIQDADEYIPVFLEFAESYNDVYLKEIVEHFIKSKKECFGDSRETSESKKRDVGMEWTCEIVRKPLFYFTFSKENKAYKEVYDFYQ